MTFGSIRNNRKEHLEEGKGQRALLCKDNSSEATQHTGAADKSTIYACGCIDLSELLMTNGNSHASTLSGARESMHGAHCAEFRQHSTCCSQAALWTRVGNQRKFKTIYRITYLKSDIAMERGALQGFTQEGEVSSKATTQWKGMKPITGRWRLDETNSSSPHEIRGGSLQWICHEAGRAFQAEAFVQ